MKDEELVKIALRARDNAYAPYSGFSVGAALLTEKGNVYSGCNVEAAAFGAGFCAECCAVGNAISSGDRNFSVIAVASSGDELCVPCGICRQMLFEFAPDLQVICADRHGNFKKYKLTDLLPHAFGKSW